MNRIVKSVSSICCGLVALGAMAAQGAGGNPLTVEGDIKQISTKARTLSVQVPGRDVMLMILHKDAVLVNAKSLRELAEGDRVTVAYTEEDGANLATNITRKVVSLPPGISAIGTGELQELIDMGPEKGGYRMFDSRPWSKFQQGHIRTAVSAPYADLAEAPARYLPSDKNTLLVFYCDGSTCDLSLSSAKLAASLGYRNVKVYPDGMPGWRKGEYCTATSLDYIRNGNIVLIDLRSPEKVREGHIPRAVGIPLQALKDAEGRFPQYKGASIVFYGENPADLREAISTVRDWDYTNAVAFVGGVEEWRNQGYPLEKGPAADKIVYERIFSVNEMGAAEFRNIMATGIYQIVDLRTREEYARGNIPGSINIPLEEVTRRIGELSREKQILLICSSGSRAEMAHDILKNRGLKIRYLKANIDYGKNGPVIGD